MNCHLACCTFPHSGSGLCESPFCLPNFTTIGILAKGQRTKLSQLPWVMVNQNSSWLQISCKCLAKSSVCGRPWLSVLSTPSCMVTGPSCHPNQRHVSGAAYSHAFLWSVFFKAAKRGKQTRKSCLFHNISARQDCDNLTKGCFVAAFTRAVICCIKNSIPCQLSWSTEHMDFAVQFHSRTDEDVLQDMGSVFPTCYCLWISDHLSFFNVRMYQHLLLIFVTLWHLQKTQRQMLLLSTSGFKDRLSVGNRWWSLICA